MKDRAVSIGIVLLLIFGGFIGLISFEPEVVKASSGNTLYVGGTGGGNYSTIQAAIDAANPGDTVFVYSGKYYENVYINKTISLTGENRDSTIINGSGFGDVIEVNANYVNITGFMVTGSGSYWEDAGIKINSVSYITIENNNISFNQFQGIYLNSTSNNTQIYNNIISNNHHGIWVIGYNNKILHNYIDSNNGCGINGGNNNLIECNTILNNNVGVSSPIKSLILNNTISFNKFIGIDLYYVIGNEIKNNSITFNYGTGISVKSSSINNITNNNISNNKKNGIEYGVLGFAYRNRLSSSSDLITANIISYNEGYGIHITDSPEYSIFHNNFINNGNQSYEYPGGSNWNMNYPTGGNYWSDYTGQDKYNGPNQDQPGGDGIGDTPYTNISGGAGVQDNYPLMNPVNWTPVNKGTLSGYVRDPQSNPIPGARVKVSFHGTYEDDYTDPNGYYYVSNIPICYCLKNVTVTKSGYGSTWIETGIVENTVHNFTLKPIINVHNIDTDEYFETIQGAIDDSDTLDGHTIIVTNGTYFENLVIDKSIKLYSITYFEYMLIDGITYPFSTDRDLPIIDGNQKDNTITINVNHVTISGFTICNGTNGILIGGNINNTIAGNNIINNDRGIYLMEDSDNNMIINNNIIKNEYGIHFIESSRNTICHNNFINNINYQARGEGMSLNYWNGNYSSGGNYWCDYTGFDEFSGPDQDQYGSDGIGDTPYTGIISTWSDEDKYPFMNPNGWLQTDPGILYGYVYDSDWNPLPDAHVKVEFHDTYLEDITDSEGYYRVTNIPICYCLKNVSVTRQGFESQWKYVSISENTFQRFLLNRTLSVLNIDTGKYFDTIQEALDDEYTLDGHTITVDNGIYFENLQVTKSVNLVGEDKNRTIIDGGGDNVLYVNTNNVNISGFNITNGDQGIYLYYSSNNNIYNNRISTNRVHGIYQYFSSNNTIAGNIFLENDFYGIYLSSSTDNSIIDNNFTGDGIFITGEQRSHFNSHTIPNNNIVNTKPLYYYKNAEDISIEKITVGQLILANCTNVNVENIEIYDTDVGLEIAYTTNATIANNNISNNLRGLYLYSSSDNHIENNTLSANTWQSVAIVSSSQNYISNNKIIENGRDGFSLGYSSNNTIINNNISSNEFTGFYFIGSSYNIFSDNILMNNFECVNMDSSSHNTVTGNRVTNNNNGFLLHLSSNNNLKGNNISSNYDRGIQLASNSNGNVIIENQISDNHDGLIVQLSSGNEIYHNNIINNVNQASDESINGNLWNDFYPSGGNYWSDYNGTDTNGDGIGDTPYIIDVYNQDNYPLMEPWNILPQEFESVTITLKLSKSEFNFRETISGSIHITNDNPFDITLNDQPFQMLAGVFFGIISTDNYNQFGAVYDHYPITVNALTTLIIDFEHNEVYTLPMDSKELNYVHLPVGNYSIYSYFHYGNLTVETINSNSVNFMIFDNLQPIVDGNDSHESDEFRQILIITSTASLIILIIILSLFISATEIGKYKFFATFAAPLYSRELKKRKKGYKDGYLRGKVHGYILGNPGEAYNTIKRKLELNNGALAYHLKVLEREHEIRAERDGLYKRFYPYEGKITDEIIELSKLQKRLYNQIKLKPGMTQKQISERLKIPTQKVNYHIKLLVGARVIRLEREGNRTICYVIEDVG